MQPACLAGPDVSEDYLLCVVDAHAQADCTEPDAFARIHAQVVVCTALIPEAL